MLVNKLLDHRVESQNEAVFGAAKANHVDLVDMLTAAKVQVMAQHLLAQKSGIIVI